MKMPSKAFLSFWSNNTLGAYADGALMFPLLLALSVKDGFSTSILLFSVGMAYIVSGFIFRVPMSVQPLKSVVIAALALGATTLEVHLSGFLVGLLCLSLLFAPVNKLANQIPRRLIHGLQLGLGIILVTQGMKMAGLGESYEWIFLFVFFVGSLILLDFYTNISLLGLLSFGIFIWALLKGSQVTLAAPANTENPIRTSMIVTLILPQLALTLTNSVVGTYDVSRRYFSERAERITVKRLLMSIGLGNVFSSFIGGLPFCHGSGGVTAHVKGGSTHWYSNLIIGGTFLALAMYVTFSQTFSIAYPPFMAGVLLSTVGIFHFTLAKPSWIIPSCRLQLFAMATVAWLTQNILWTLGIGIAFECFLSFNKIAQKGYLK
ncbi:MAG: hypothetical protein KAG53_02855 [Endozoicomonadaceae bacterium]|nr:hypothetical protein [Endozoicomonadaceae bacterium]